MVPIMRLAHEVPTLAELEFMNTVQDASPAVNYLFNTNGTYWCAMPYWYYDFGANKRNQFTNNASSQKADGIRCVMRFIFKDV